MREIETGIFRDLNQLELIQNDFSMRAIQKGKKALHKHLYKKMRNKAEDFDIYGMMELQKQPLYKNALMQIVAAYDIEDQLIAAAKGWDFAVLNTSVFDALFTDKEMKKQCAEKVVFCIARGDFESAEKTLIEFIKKARIRTVEHSYNFIDFKVERYDIDLIHGRIAKDGSSAVVRVYDETTNTWLLPLDFYKLRKEVTNDMEAVGFTKDVLEKMLEEEPANE